MTFELDIRPAGSSRSYFYVGQDHSSKVGKIYRR